MVPVVSDSKNPVPGDGKLPEPARESEDPLSIEVLEAARDRAILKLIASIPKAEGSDLTAILKVLDERTNEKRAKEGPAREERSKGVFDRKKALEELQGRALK